MEMQIDSSSLEELFQQQGWSFSRLRLGETRWMSANKQFDSAGGARPGIIYLRAIEAGGMSIRGTYESAGEDVLAAHIQLVPADQLGKITAIAQQYLEEAHRLIENSWGRRVLRAA